jgi:hypothetical protein
MKTTKPVKTTKKTKKIEDANLEPQNEKITMQKIMIGESEYEVDARVVELCQIREQNIPKDVFETMLFFANIIIRVGPEPFMQLTKQLSEIISQTEVDQIKTFDKQILLNILSYSTDYNIPSLHNFICYTL